MPREYHRDVAGGKPETGFQDNQSFPRGKLRETIEEIFVATVRLLNQNGYVSFEKYFVDGTKIESAANKYTFVWKKAVEKNEWKLDEKLRVFLREVNEICGRDDEDSKDVKKLKKAKRQIEKDFLPGKEKYEKANATFDDRNCYSKTDEEATFMRMAEEKQIRIPSDI